MRTAPPRTIPTSGRRRRQSRTALAALLWFVGMTPLAFWGLPDRSRDALLFGGEPAWEAERFAADAALDLRRTRLAGADTDLDPLPVDRRIVDLTATDADRAAILRRFRLFSRQPDEMITLMALQRMSPRRLDFDPKLYQYGGAYVYLVGALIAASSLAGLTSLSAGVQEYLADPERFARFYLVGRFASLAFGALTLLAAARLARLAGGRRAGWWAFALVAGCPVFITLALEAKPHLPSTCLILWAILAALRFHARPGRRAALRVGLLAGGAFGMVLTGLTSAASALVLACLHRRRGAALRALGLGLAVAAAVYVVTNPYVVLNALSNRASLGSNLANSLSMYEVSRIGSGAWRVAELLVEAAGAPMLLIGLIGGCLIARRWPAPFAVSVAPAAAIVLLCAAIGADKPAEYGRFLLLPALLLAIGGAVLLQRAWAAGRVGGGFLTAAVLAGMLVWPGSTTAYVRSFAVDAFSTRETRLSAARYFLAHAATDEAVGVLQFQEPAPYGTPPIDFARRRVLLLPDQMPTRHEMRRLPPWLLVCADDAARFSGAWWAAHYALAARFPPTDRGLSRIAWANKPAFVFRRVAPDAAPADRQAP